MGYWLLLAYLCYGAGLGAWVGDHSHELFHYLLCSMEAVSEALLAFKHTIRAAR